MDTLPPLLFEPHFVPKPWGGRRLASWLDGAAETGTRIGEAWLLGTLPGWSSAIRRGPLSGETLDAILARHPDLLLGTSRAAAPPLFPWMVKFLDATEPLSVQVHPPVDAADVLAGRVPTKSEAWYVVQADADACIYAGFRADVALDDVRAVLGKAELIELLQQHQVSTGDCFYLPGGTVHALGAGLLVAEIQTPADVTYRLYDWDRRANNGPRELHLDAGADALRLQQPTAVHVGGRTCEARHAELVRGDDFTLRCAQIGPATEFVVAPTALSVWVMLRGQGVLTDERDKIPIEQGDAVLFPARRDTWVYQANQESEWLIVDPV